jgi:hypothetical protein
VSKEQSDRIEPFEADQRLKEFCSKFPKEITLKAGARILIVTDPTSGTKTDLASAIAFLISQYGMVERRGNIIAKMLSTHDYGNRMHSTMELDQRMKTIQQVVIPFLGEQTKVAGALLGMINLAYVHDLIEDGSEKRINDLRQENARLNERAEVLSKQLKECQEGLSFFQRRFPDLSRNSEIGDVDKQ